MQLFKKQQPLKHTHQGVFFENVFSAKGWPKNPSKMYWVSLKYNIGVPDPSILQNTLDVRIQSNGTRPGPRKRAKNNKVKTFEIMMETYPFSFFSLTNIWPLGSNRPTQGRDVRAEWRVTSLTNLKWIKMQRKHVTSTGCWMQPTWLHIACWGHPKGTKAITKKPMKSELHSKRIRTNNEYKADCICHGEHYPQQPKAVPRLNWCNAHASNTEWLIEKLMMKNKDEECVVVCMRTWDCDTCIGVATPVKVPNR